MNFAYVLEVGLCDRYPVCVSLCLCIPPCEFMNAWTKSTSEEPAWTGGCSSWIFLPWRWRRYVPPKCRFTQDLHGATSQETAFFLTEPVFHILPVIIRKWKMQTYLRGSFPIKIASSKCGACLFVELPIYECRNVRLEFSLISMTHSRLKELAKQS
jgi:hypothetical protein